MKKLDTEALLPFINEGIERFHEARIARINQIDLNGVLKKKNPYLFRAKNQVSAGELVTSLLDAFLSSSEEKIFGDFLEELAIYISEQTCGGRKSTAQGLDMEFDDEGYRYLISVKSGPNWGNSSQHKKLREDFLIAKRVQSQARTSLIIQPVLGICYGKNKTTDNGVFIKYTGQSFWHFISGDPNLYLDIIEPIGYRAKEHNEAYGARRIALENKFTGELISRFCDADGYILWEKLVMFNSKNLPD